MKKNLVGCITVFTTLLSTQVYQAQTLSAGGSHSHYVCNNSKVTSWGNNSYGQLGIGTQHTHERSVTVPSLIGITAVSAGSDHTLFLKNDGTVLSSGRNDYGALGDRTFNRSSTPVQVYNVTNITAIAAGKGYFGSSLFLKNDGTVWSCGLNDQGQAGVESAQFGSSIINPVMIPTLQNIKAIGTGSSHSCYIKQDGTVWMSGSNWYGELGNSAPYSTTTYTYTPVQMPNLSDVKAFEGGFHSSLFLKNDGTVWACGLNDDGELADGTTQNRLIPFRISSLSGITAIAIGYGSSYFLKNDGTVWACGSNNVGQLGDGTTTDRLTPVRVSGLSGIVSISAGTSHALFLKNDGTIYSCGLGLYGQLGNGLYYNVSTPAPIQVCEMPDPLIANFTSTPSNICTGSCINFTDNSTPNATSWNWTFEGGTPATSNVKNPTGICFNTPGTKRINLTISNGISTSTVNQNIEVSNNLAVAFFQMTQQTLCSGTQLTLINASACATQASFLWEFGDGTSTTTTNLNSVQHLYTNAGQYMVKLTATSSNGTTSVFSLPVRVIAPPIPFIESRSGQTIVPAITGPTVICPIDNRSYSVQYVPGQTFTWTVSEGMMITGGQGTNNISVSFICGFKSGQICVTASNECGTNKTTCLPVSRDPLYDQQGIITGLKTICKNETTGEYGILAMHCATGYHWTVPTGVTITSPSNSNSTVIQVSFDPSFREGDITVERVTTCGSEPVQHILVKRTTSKFCKIKKKKVN